MKAWHPGLRLMWLLAILTVGAAAGSVWGDEEVRVAIINSDVILAAYEPLREAQEVLARENRTWEEQAAELQAEYDQLREELESQRLMLSEERLREREREVDELRRQLEDYVGSVWGDEGRAAQRNLELTKPIIDKINEILQRICEEEGYGLVLDAAGGFVVFAVPEMDLTPTVLEELEREAESSP